MNATQALRQLGQTLWLHNTMRTLPQSDTRERYIRDLSVTGLTSNPTIFGQATRAGEAVAPLLQREGVEAFAASWDALTCIREKCAWSALRV